MKIKYILSIEDIKEVVKFWAKEQYGFSNPEIEVNLSTVLKGYGQGEHLAPDLKIVVTSEEDA